MSNSLKSIILQSVKEKFPKIQWSLGSLVREIIIEPLSYLADIFDSYISTAEAELDITSILADPESNKSAIDSWITRLGLTLPEQKNASGTVKILVDSPEEFTVNDAETFTYDGFDLVVQGTHTFGTLDNPFVVVGIDCYELEVPVTSGSNSAISISSGVSVNWSSAPSTVLDMYIGDPVCGGVNEITYQEKANLIKNTINNNPTLGKEYLSSVICKNFSATITDASAGAKDISRPFDVVLYLKPTRHEGQVNKKATTYLKDSKIYVEIDALGLTNILSVIDTYGIEQTIVSIKKEGIGKTGSKVTIELSGIAAGQEVTVRCTGFSVYQDVQKWLDEGQKYVPYNYTLAVPNIANIKLDFKVDKELTSDAKEMICSYINNKPLDGALRESEINQILTDLGYTLLGCIVFSADLNYDGNNSVVSQASMLDCSGTYYGDGRPTALFITTNNIRGSY